MAKYLFDLRWASNNSVYNKVIKYKRASRKEISCDFCPYHKIENHNRKPYHNWKSYRKTQYK